MAVHSKHIKVVREVYFSINFKLLIMANVSYTVRVMRKEDVPGAMDIWKETGKRKGKNCVYTWMEVDPEAFNVAVTDSGEIIAVCCGLLHHEDFAFLGAYACKAKYRGLGISFKVWEACLKHIGPNRNAALNSTWEKLYLYRDRAGFSIVETGWTCVVNEIYERRVDHTVLSNTPPDGVEVLPFEDLHFPQVLEFDLSLIGYSRELALQLTFREGDSRTLVALKGGKCVGFGTIKLSVQNAGQVGPLYADDPAVAEVLLRRLIVALPQATGFVMMTVDVNKPANEFLKRIGCPAIQESPRLYRREKMNVDLNKIFAQFTLSFSPF